MSTAVNYETAELVLYHGSRSRMHGEWLLAGPCICQRCVAKALSGTGEGSYELADVYGTSLRITCVRRESFTPYSEFEPPVPVEHKTRTSQPSGYVYGADGSRMSTVRGGLQRDPASWWRCTCGKVGAGATREEARSWARRHRKDEAAKQQAATDEALALLRAKLATP